MATVKGFRGIRFNKELISDYKNLVAPPYDVINSNQQNELYGKDPHNVIRLILAKGDGEERYSNASETYKEWLDNSILIQDDEQSIYPYYQEFEFEGTKYTRKGFMAVVKVEDFTNKTVLPHEQTFKKHKEDRLKLTTACNSNLSQVFSVYSDKEGKTEKLIDSFLSEPIIDVTTDDGVKNVFWKISDPDLINQIAENLTDKSLLIADGHHRYETAINFRNQQREKFGEESGNKPYDYVMMYLSRGEGEGLIINPTHRLVKDLSLEEFTAKITQFFEIKEISKDYSHELERDEIIFVHKDLSSNLLLRSTKKFEKDYENLAVMLLHNIIFNEVAKEENLDILYTKFEQELFDLTNSVKYDAGFLLPKLNAADIFDVVLDDVKMPHKTTYFYPKVLSGLVFNPLW